MAMCSFQGKTTLTILISNMSDTPQAKEAGSSHPDYFARVWTIAYHLETTSAHPHARTHNRPTHPITHHDQRYTAAEQQQQDVQQGLRTLIHTN